VNEPAKKKNTKVSDAAAKQPFSRMDDYSQADRKSWVKFGEDM